MLMNLVYEIVSGQGVSLTTPPGTPVCVERGQSGDGRGGKAGGWLLREERVGGERCGGGRRRVDVYGEEGGGGNVLSRAFLP